MRLSQNFSFWESYLRFNGKNGYKPIFPRAFLKTNRVLGKAQISLTFIIDAKCINHSVKKGEICPFFALFPGLTRHDICSTIYK